MPRPVRVLALSAVLVASVLIGATAGCGGTPSEGGDRRQARPVGRRPGAPVAAAVPVEVAPVMRRSISSFIQTTGTLEAENEVDLVARTSAPIVEMRVEEGDAVRAGQVLARLDELEHRTQLEISRVALNNAEEVKLIAAYSRYLNLYLSEKGVLAQVYKDVRDLAELTVSAQVAVLERHLDKPLAEIESDWVAWFRRREEPQYWHRLKDTIRQEVEQLDGPPW